MKQIRQVVMLPTESRGGKALTILNNKAFDTSLDPKSYNDYKQGAKHYHLHIISDEEIKEGDWVYDAGSNQVYRYVYTKDLSICSTNNYNRTISGENALLRCKKVIATTDSSLNIEIPCPDGIEGCAVYHAKQLPQIPESFIKAYIKAYNEGKPITEVNVEYEIKEINYSSICKHNLSSIAKQGFRSYCTECKNYLDKIFEYRTQLKLRQDNTTIISKSEQYSQEELIGFAKYCLIQANDSNNIGSIDKFVEKQWKEKFGEI